MRQVGVAATLKHFPGLGRATGNTDSDPTATDPTTRHDRLLGPFAAGVAARSPFVMVSSATYPRITPVRRACFSSAVIRDMLRGDLGFDGVVLSDSFGSASVSSVPPGRRAIRFLTAGGTMVLDSNYLDAKPMTAAVVALMERDPVFADLVEDDVRLILEVKQRYGLIN
jgi:beta-N-acetylhexosaminidase